MNSTKSKSSTEGILLFIFIVIAVLVFGAQVFIPSNQISQREAVLFSAFEMGVSLGIGWVLQRIDSRRQFQESLKQFAISAYRRIVDIEKSADRFMSEVQRMRKTYSHQNVHELDILGAIGAEMQNTIGSSKADWTDVIGQEIQLRERADEIQSKLRWSYLAAETASSDNTKAKIDSLLNNYAELAAELAEIRSQLPSSLQLDIADPADLISPSEINLRNRFEYLLVTKGHLVLRMMVSDNVEHLLKPGTIVSLHQDNAPFGFMGCVVFLGNQQVGSIIPPDELDDREFGRALVHALRSTELIPFELPARIIGQSPIDKKEFLIECPSNYSDQDSSKK